MDITIQVTGWDELVKKVNDPALLGEPMRGFFNNSTLTIQRNVQTLTPVDTGRLRASVTSLVDTAPLPQYGEVGTNVFYGPFVENGNRPHYPLTGAMTGWAARPGMNVYALVRAIGRRGTRARRMFQQGAQQSMAAIEGYLRQAASEIEDRWGK